MITKERLEELIEQGATIWKVLYGTPIETKLNKNSYVCNQLNLREDYLMEYSTEEWSHTMSGLLSHLFETKEDAEEYAEFGNITRTERLELPSWEEFNKVSTFTFKRKDGADMEIAIWHNCPDDDCKTIKITHSYDWTACCFEKPLTRENYDEARRICVKLFKGETDG